MTPASGQPAVCSFDIDGNGSSPDGDGILSRNGANLSAGGTPTAHAVAAGFHYATATEGTYSLSTATFLNVSMSADMEM